MIRQISDASAQAILGRRYRRVKDGGVHKLPFDFGFSDGTVQSVLYYHATLGWVIEKCW